MPKDFDKCAVDFVALVRYSTQTLIVEGLACSKYVYSLTRMSAQTYAQTFASLLESLSWVDFLIIVNKKL